MVFAAASLKNALDDGQRRLEGRDRQDGDDLLCRELGARQADRGGRAGRHLHLRRPRLDGLSVRARTLIEPDTASTCSATASCWSRRRTAPSRSTIAPGFHARRALGDGKLAMARRRVGAGRQIRQGGAGKARRLGQRRRQASPQAENVRAALALVSTRRGAARHRLPDRRDGRAGREGRRHVPGGLAPADHLSGGADRRLAKPDARRPSSNYLRSRPRRKALFEAQGFTFVASDR